MLASECILLAQSGLRLVWRARKPLPCTLRSLATPASSATPARVGPATDIKSHLFDSGLPPSHRRYLKFNTNQRSLTRPTASVAPSSRPQHPRLDAFTGALLRMPYIMAGNRLLSSCRTLASKRLSLWGLPCPSCQLLVLTSRYVASLL